MSEEDLREIDQRHVWHPYAAMPNAVPCFPVQSAHGVEIQLTNGQKLVDGMSSWWAAIHGYNHPRLNHAAIQQMKQMSHVMFGGLTHEPAVRLAQKLVQITPKGLQHVFYCDSGSVSVEVGMKMALQYWYNLDPNTKKHRFLTIRGGYHGDTFKAMSVCDPVNGMHHLFSAVLLPQQQIFVQRPHIGFYDEEEWDERDIEPIRTQLEQCHQTIAAIILEPIVQGAGGMRFYHPTYLRHVRELCNEYQVLLILDEIATGFGRSGKLFASEHAGIEPDILCIGKALSGGFLSFAATMTTTKISQVFAQGEAGVFMHGPTFMGNPLACAVSLESINLLMDKDYDWKGKVQTIERQLKEELAPCRESSHVNDVRVLGAIGVVEMKEPFDMKTVQPEIVKKGVWLRPFGRLLYTMPPFITKPHELQKITNAMVSIAQKHGFSTTAKNNNPWTEERVSAHGMVFRVSISSGNNKDSMPVLCLPGALGTGSSDFEALLRGGLGDEFQVIALDPRGLGGSKVAGIERDYPLDFYLRDALDGAAVMKALGYSKYHVMGWSDGANSAIHLAAHPDTRVAVDKLIVWGGNAFVTKEDCEAWESIRSIDNWSDRMRHDKSSIHGGVEELQILNDKATDGWISQYTNPRKAGDVCLTALHHVHSPTLVLHGAKDVICDTRHARYIARQIADSELIIFPEGKHNLHQRHADAFHEVVRGFFLNNGHDLPKEEGHKALSDKQEEPVIDEIAYAFMGSKSLFTALRAGIFDAIDECTRRSDSKEASFEDIEQASSIKGERLRTLLSACVALKLIRRKMVRGNDTFSLPKASADQLVRSSKRYWGDYISGQVDAQFYARMVDLDETMTSGTAASCGYETWFDSDPVAAKRYTEAQHNGSLATAYALHKRLPELAEQYPNMRLLDVGGGSGAFSIATARKIPGAECVVLDLPNVTTVADEIIGKETDSTVKSRLSTLSLSATAPDQWKGLVGDESFDVVLCSYVSGSVPTEALSGLYSNAFRVLKPGGSLVIHDFFVDNNGEGPRSAALWALAHVTVNPEGMGLRPNRIVDLLTKEGFVAPKVDDLIPGATQIVVVSKPVT